VVEVKTLVVYYSRTGNTRLVAQEIITALKADVEELRDEKNRRGVIGFMKSGMDSMLKKESKLKPLKRNLDEYDTIFVGSPTWGGNTTSPVRAFLSQNDLSGKKVALFCTAAGSPGKNMASMKEYLKDAEVVGELAVLNPEMKSKYKQKVAEWINSLK
jgi:flavodoxin